MSEIPPVRTPEARQANLAALIAAAKPDLPEGIAEGDDATADLSAIYDAVDADQVVDSGENFFSACAANIAAADGTAVAQLKQMTADERLGVAGYLVDRHGFSEADAMAAIEKLSGRKANKPGNGAAERLSLTWCSQLKPQLETNDFIEGLMCSGSLIVIYGASGAMKTGVVTDLMMHVAANKPWCGHDVDHGCTVYQAGEGGRLFDNRPLAFTHHHGLNPQVIPFATMREQVNLLDGNADIELIVRRIKEAEAATKLPVRAFVSDTLSRAIAGGNENDSADMGKVVMNADRIRAETNAAVIFVHHTGKDAGKGARGHSLLRAAADTEIEVSCSDSGIVTVRVTKQRDMKCDGQFAFTSLPVELGTNRRGKPVTSFVMVPTDAPTREAAPMKMSAPCTIALQALRQAVVEAGEVPPANNHIPDGIRVTTPDLWRRYAYAKAISDEGTDAKRKAFKRASEQLQARGIVAAWGEWVWPT